MTRDKEQLLSNGQPPGRTFLNSKELNFYHVNMYYEVMMTIKYRPLRERQSVGKECLSLGMDITL